MTTHDDDAEARALDRALNPDPFKAEPGHQGAWFDDDDIVNAEFGPDLGDELIGAQTVWREDASEEGETD